MGRFDGKVAYITGAARGQGRSHAARLAREGAELGGVDIVLANAGIGLAAATADPAHALRDQLDVNLTGVWNSVQAAAPLMIEQGRGGAVVLTSSSPTCSTSP